MATADTVQLHFLRHADAGDPEAWTGSDDNRPLSAKGDKQSARLGRFLAGVGFRPDAIITSPKVRAARTAELVAEPLGVEVRADERLGRSLDLVAIEAILFDAGEPERPVLVGHDPDFSDLLAELIGASGVSIRKGALARIDARRPLEPGAGTLRWLVPPDLLKGSSSDGR
jgi:phosphohistidine phosphatase